MTLQANRLFILATITAASHVAGTTHANIINNGIAGDGRWEVSVRNGGSFTYGALDIPGSVGLTDLIFSSNLFVDVGNDCNGTRLNESITSAAAVVGGQVISSGSFAGQNGTIFWTTRSSIAPGTSVLQTQVEFSSSEPFGITRVSQFLDAVPNVVSGPNANDNLVAVGTPGADDFRLFTIDVASGVAVSQYANYNSSSNMTYAGWAGDDTGNLRADILGAGAAFSIAGEVGPPLSFLTTTDRRLPGSPAFGPDDIEIALAFDLNPSAVFARTTFFTEALFIPAPGATALLPLGGVLLARRRR